MRRVPSVLLVLLLVGFACGAGDEPAIHEVQGRVAKVLKQGGELVVDHEDIPGFMMAMQMNLAVREPAQARELAPGDKIRFQLHVTDRGSWVEGIERLPPETELSLAPSAGR